MSQIRKSYCHLCQALCGIKATLDANNLIIKIEPNFDDPISKGYICEKSQKLIEFQYNEDRITEPLRKTASGYEVVSWDDALDDISQQLTPDQAIYMAKTDQEYASLLAYEMINRLGIQYVTNVYSMEKAYSALVPSLMFNNMAVPDTENSQTHIVIGQNPWVTQHTPRVRANINSLTKDPDRQLIVIDPCITETTKRADKHFQLRPGTDAWLLSAIIKILIDNDYIDQQFVADHCDNFDKVKKHFSQLDLLECSDVCGIPVADINELANIINQSNSVSILSGNGIDHSLYPMASSYLISLLYLITGNFQRVGTMLINDGSIVPGMVSDHYFTQPTVPFGKQKQLAGITNASYVTDNIDKFDTVIIDNSNPAIRYPNQQKFKEQISQVGLVVVLDSFMSETAKLADYVLPTPTFLEKLEIVTSTSDKAQLSFPVVDKTKARLNIDIFENILERRKLIDHKQLEYFSNLWNQNQSQFFTELYNLYVKKDPVAYYTMYKIANTSAHPLVSIATWKFFIAGMKKLSLEESISTATKLSSKLSLEHFVQTNFDIKLAHKINLAPMQLLLSARLNSNKLTNDKWPYILQCGYRQKTSMNELIKNNEQAKLEIGSMDANKLSIRSGDTRTVSTQAGEVTLECLVDTNLQSGLLRITNHAIINKLTSTDNVDYLNPQNKFVFADIK